MGFYSGVFNTTQNPAELNQRSFAAHILRKFPDGAAPIFALTSQVGRSKAKASTHGYFTKTLTFAQAQINAGAGYADNILVFTVDNAQGLAADQIIHVARTQENMRIVSVDSATQITVVRGVGRVAAAALLDDDWLVVVGTAFAEGSNRPAARGLTTVYVPNYTQIFRNAWALTNTAKASLAEAGFSNIAENKRDCTLMHSVEMESALIFSQPKMDVTGAQPYHTTQGIIDSVEQYAAGNTNTADAGTSYTELVALLEPAFQFSHDLGDTKSRLMFAGSTAVKVIDDIGRLNGQYQIVQGQTAFGLHFKSFTFYKGTVNIIEHPILNGLKNMNGLALTLDMPAMKLAYLEGRDTMPEEYGGDGKNNANGVDATGGSLTTEFATEFMNPAGCSVIYGLIAGAVG